MMMKLVGAIQRTHKTNRRLQYDNIAMSNVIGFPEVVNVRCAEVAAHFVVAKKGSVPGYVFEMDCLICANKQNSPVALTGR
jgi:hypothetical protein